MSKQKTSKLKKIVSEPISSEKTSKKEPATMGELLSLYGAGFKRFLRGDKIKGKVVSIDPKKVVLDIGGKSEAIVAEKAYLEARDFIKTLKIGDEVIASVIVGENPEGYVIVSLRDAAYEAIWDKLYKAREFGKEIAVLGKVVTQAGIMVDVEGLTGFIPLSQLGKDAASDSSLLVGKHFKVKVLEIDKRDNKIVLSEKEVSEAADIKVFRDAFDKIKEGEIYDGVVTTIANFGCFVAINTKGISNVEGLVHISELSWGKVGNVSDIVSEGDKVKVKVIGKKDDRLALSLKQAQTDPWFGVAKKYKKEQKVKGKVIKISEFGVFVEIEKGVEGLIHITKIPPGQKLNEGDEVNVYVEEIDEPSRRISLGLVLTAKPVGYK